MATTVLYSACTSARLHMRYVLKNPLDEVVYNFLTIHEANGQKYHQ